MARFWVPQSEDINPGHATDIQALVEPRLLCRIRDFRMVTGCMGIDNLTERHGSKNWEPKDGVAAQPMSQKR
jgi:hypothetical protein